MLKITKSEHIVDKLTSHGKKPLSVWSFTIVPKIMKKDLNYQYRPRVSRYFTATTRRKEYHKKASDFITKKLALVKTRKAAMSLFFLLFKIIYFY